MKSGSGWGLDFVFLALCAGALFAFQLGDRALWSPDEGRYAEVAREMVVSGDYVTPRLEGVKFFEKPPLFYWLQSAAIRLFGVNEWALRLWPALFAVLGCLAVYVGGRKFFDRRTGSIAAAVLATSGLYYAMSRVANLDMGLTTLLSAALLSFLAGTRSPPGFHRRAAMAAFFGLIALAVLDKGLIGVVLPALIITTWVALTGEWRILKTLHLPSGLFLFTAVAAPWHILAARANPEFFYFYFVREHFQRFLYKNGPLDHPWTFAPVLLIGLFPWTVFLFQALRYNLQDPPASRRNETVFFLVWAGWVFLFFSLSSSKVVPYILPMFPALAILLGRYLSAAWERPVLPGIGPGLWAFVCAALVIAAFGLKGPQHYLERYSNWPDLEVPHDEATIPSTSSEAYPDLAPLKPYLAAQGVILITGALAAVYLRRRKGLSWAVPVLAASSALFLVVLNSSLPIFDERRSVKDLALALKPRLTSADEVASYHAYYQDLPLYLQRRVTQVGWIEPFELWEEDRNQRADDEGTFWQRWNGPATIYILTDRDEYDKLRSDAKDKIFLVAQTDYDVMLSNRPWTAQ
ncbi:MAG TPA: phospholipid carrier-dependent glycosyltransferase [Candidatus Binatia bacterium]|jgi:4-amino-4-deoxy-L-arabinose transferase-like glycosyltransferase